MKRNASMRVGGALTRCGIISEQRAARHSKNNTSHDRSKHIDVRAYALRDAVRNGTVQCVSIDTKHQLADMLTKHQTKTNTI